MSMVTTAGARDGPGATFVLANTGYPQSLINPPGASKPFYLAAPASMLDPAQWAQFAQVPAGQRGTGPIRARTLPEPILFPKELP